MFAHRPALLRAFYLGFALGASSFAAAAVSPNIVISQVYGGGGNTGSVYKNDFIELFNRGSLPVNVNGWSVQYAGATGTSWSVTNLTNVTIQPGQYYLVQQAAGTGGTTSLPAPDATGTSAMSGAAGKVAVSSSTTTLTGACPTGGSLVDFVGFGATANCFEGSGPTPAPSNTASVSRAANGCTDTDSNPLDFSVASASPRNTLTPQSPCISATPNVSISLSTNAASEAALTVVTVTATSSAPVTGNQTVALSVTGPGITAGDYTLSNTTITILSGQTTGSVTFTVIDDGLSEGPETAAIALTTPSAGITLGAPSSANVAIADSSPATITRIHTVQGSGSASPLAGQIVTIEGIVTASFQATTELSGFFVQEEDVNADADPLTSEGIFVFHTATHVLAGQKVRVTGTVTEFGTTVGATLTEITTATVSIVSSGNPLPAAVTLTLPVAAQGDLERFEGMRVQTAQTLTVSQNFALARFGELTLSANGRLPQPSNFIDPNDAIASGTTSSGTSNVAAITAQIDLNKRSSILLADTGSTQNPAVIPFLDPVDKTLRVGSTLASLSGVLTQSFGNFAIHATTPPVFAYAPRPLTPPVVGGALKVASFNVLNFFNGDGAGGGFPTARGADTPLEFTRQKAKTVAALCGLGADVVGLMEMENDATTAAPALNELTAALSATSGCGAWSFVANPVGWGSFPGSTDAIRPALIYRSTVVATVGAALSPNDPAFTQGRAPVAQTFRVISGASTGAKLSVIVNHFKSKGGTGTFADADQGDGQAAFNATRKAQATALLSFITTLQAAANDPDVLVIGDLNAYSEEDPIDILRAGGLVKLDSGGYSYVFDAQTGSLDHALATPSLVAQITNTGVWHINADEPIILDYNLEFKSPLTCTVSCLSPDYYAPTPFRSSDHDPVLVGMALNGATLDIDDSAPTTPYDAASDGVLLLRYLLGFRDDALISGAISPVARRNATQIAQHIELNRLRFDVDGDGQTLALTDGVMILRRLLGITDAAAITQGVKNSSRTDADVVSAIDALKP